METTDGIQKNWVKIYPSYLDKNIKHSEGRKVPNDVAVENPTSREIFFDCGEILRLNAKEEKVKLEINLIQNNENI